MRITLLLAALFISSPLKAEECVGGSRCVPPEDMGAFIQVLKEKKCLQTEQPQFQLDPITIITDEKGRIFYTGDDPKNPYKLKMTWCDYAVEGTGSVKVVAAMREPEVWGFRLRPKAYLGYLPLEPSAYATEANKGVDAGLMLDFFHLEFANVDVAMGFRSFGAGVGVDITTNFGFYAGYALSWANWRHNVNAALWFAF